MSGAGGKQNPFTLLERKKIERFIKDGLTGGEIAQKLGRSKTGTNCEIRQHGGRQNYIAENAQRFTMKASTNDYCKLLMEVYNWKNSEKVDITTKEID